MILKSVWKAALCACVVMWSGLSLADDYKASEFLNLDLSKAVLSPKRLGPPATFEHVAIQADSGPAVAQAAPEPQATPEPKPVVASAARKHQHRVAQRTEKPRGEARNKLAHRHGNPMDAMASDTRIQTWPCRSGGICNWQRK